MYSLIFIYRKYYWTLDALHVSVLGFSFINEQAFNISEMFLLILGPKLQLPLSKWIPMLF